MASLIHFARRARGRPRTLLTMTACGLYMWRVMARCFCTSLNLDERMVVTGSPARPRPLLQRGVQLGEGHGHGVGAQGVEHVDVDGRLDHADLQARQVFSLGDGLLLLVTLRNPAPSRPGPPRFLALSLSSSFLPKGPSVTASASCGEANRKGKS